MPATHVARLSSGILFARRGAVLLEQRGSGARRAVMAKELAEDDDAILIVAGQGCGKGVLAQDIHRIRATQKEVAPPFMVVKPAPENPETSAIQLFGVEGNVYRDPDPRPGKLEQVGTGTILIDDLQRWPTDQQTQLHRVVENREYEPRPGSTNGIPKNFRGQLILTLNEAPDAAVASGHLLGDLLDRLKARTIWIPPLSDERRRLDIPYICRRAVRALREAADPKIADATPFEKEDDDAIADTVREAATQSARYLVDELEGCLGNWRRARKGERPFDLAFVKAWLEGRPPGSGASEGLRERMIAACRRAKTEAAAAREFYKEEISRLVREENVDRSKAEERYRGQFRRDAEKLGIEFRQIRAGHAENSTDVS